MATVAVKIKVLPKSPSIDLEPIKEQSKEKIESEGGVINNFEEQDVAFGLKCLIATMAWPEEKNTDLIQNIFQNIEGVSSTDIIDYRRAFG